MSNEEFEKRFEKKIEFILEQQAQFAAGMQQQSEAQAHTEHLLNNLASMVKTTIDTLKDAHLRLTEAQARTDESLRNLTIVIDRYFSKGRNDKSEDKN